MGDSPDIIDAADRPLNLEDATPEGRAVLLSAIEGGPSEKDVEEAYLYDLLEGSEYEAYALLSRYLHYAEPILDLSFESQDWLSKLEQMAECFQENNDAESFERLGSFEIDRLIKTSAGNETIISRAIIFLTKYFSFGCPVWNRLVSFRLLLLDVAADRCLDELGSQRRVSKELRSCINEVLSLLPIQLSFGMPDKYNSCYFKLKEMWKWRVPEANKAVIESALRILSTPGGLGKMARDRVDWCYLKYDALRGNPAIADYLEAASETVDDFGVQSREERASSLGLSRLEFDYSKLRLTMEYYQCDKDLQTDMEPITTSFHDFAKKRALENGPEDLNGLCDYYEALWYALVFHQLSREESEGLLSAHNRIRELCLEGSLGPSDLELLSYTLVNVVDAALSRVSLDHNASVTHLGIEASLALLRVLNSKIRTNAVLAASGSSVATTAFDDDVVAFENASWAARKLLGSCNDGAETGHVLESLVYSMDRCSGGLREYYSELAICKNLRYKVELLKQRSSGIADSLRFVGESLDYSGILGRIHRGTMLVDLFFVRDSRLFFSSDSRSVRNEENDPEHLIAFILSPSSCQKQLQARYLGRSDVIKRLLEEYLSNETDSVGELARLVESMLGNQVDEGITTVIFCSDGLFNNVSLASLPYGDGYVLDRFAVRNISSVEDVSIGKENANAKRGIVLSSPAFGSGTMAHYRPLRGSIAEGRAVEALLSEAYGAENVDCLNRGKASKRELTRLLAEGDCRIVHLSSHGDLRDGVPCVVLSGANDGGDALLFPRDLPCDSMRGTELVVLALCYGGAMSTDPGDGMSGFVKAVLLNGASSAVLPVREIDDKASAAFFKLFYSLYLGEGDAPIEKVVRDTILSLRSLNEKDVGGLLSASSVERIQPFAAKQRVSDGEHPFDRLECWAPWVCYSNSLGVDKSTPDSVWGNEGTGRFFLVEEGGLTRRSVRLMNQAKAAVEKQRKLSAAFPFLITLEKRQQLTAGAAALLAKCYLYGIGTEADGKRGIALAESAADAGHAGAQLTLGKCRYLGFHTEKSPEEAWELLHCAASAGSHEAALYLSEMYYYGCGVQRSSAESLAWAERALEDGGTHLSTETLRDIARLYLACSKLSLRWEDEGEAALAREMLIELEEKWVFVCESIRGKQDRARDNLDPLSPLSAIMSTPWYSSRISGVRMEGVSPHLPPLADKTAVGWLGGLPDGVLAPNERLRIAVCAAAEAVQSFAEIEVPRKGLLELRRRFRGVGIRQFLVYWTRRLNDIYPGFSAFILATAMLFSQDIPNLNWRLTGLENSEGLLHLLDDMNNQPTSEDET